MEQQIQDLIASIKKEGIESATNESRKILEEARKEADRIIGEALKEKEKMLQEAERKIALEKESSLSSVRQAARDVSLTLKKSIGDKFRLILAKKVSGAMDEAFIREALMTVVKSGFDCGAVELPSSLCDAVASSLAAEMGKEAVKGIEFRPSTSLSGGFRVYSRDGENYVDLSDDECTSLLYPYLSSSLKDLI